LILHDDKGEIEVVDFTYRGSYLLTRVAVKESQTSVPPMTINVLSECFIFLVDSDPASNTHALTDAVFCNRQILLTQTVRNLRLTLIIQKTPWLIAGAYI